MGAERAAGEGEATAEDGAVVRLELQRCPSH